MPDPSSVTYGSPADIILDLGSIKGESKDIKHKDKIDVVGWRWGASNPANSHIGGGGGTGRVTVNDLTVRKYIDKASPEIFLSCCNGTPIREALLILRKAGTTPLEYFTIKMHDVVISSYTTGLPAGDSDPRFAEEVTLNFSKVTVGYVEQTSKNGAGGARSEVGWDIEGNAKL